MLWVLRQVREVSRLELADDAWRSRLDKIDEQAVRFGSDFRQRIFTDVLNRQLGSHQASSLMHDLNYSARITQGFRNILQLGLADGNELIREVRRLGSNNDDLPLVLMSR